MLGENKKKEKRIIRYTVDELIKLYAPVDDVPQYFSTFEKVFSKDTHTPELFKSPNFKIPWGEKVNPAWSGSSRRGGRKRGRFGRRNYPRGRGRGRRGRGGRFGFYDIDEGNEDVKLKGDFNAREESENAWKQRSEPSERKQDENLKENSHEQKVNSFFDSDSITESLGKEFHQNHPLNKDINEPEPEKAEDYKMKNEMTDLLLEEKLKKMQKEINSSRNVLLPPLQPQPQPQPRENNEKDMLRNAWNEPKKVFEMENLLKKDEFQEKHAAPPVRSLLSNSTTQMLNENSHQPSPSSVTRIKSEWDRKSKDTIYSNNWNEDDFWGDSDEEKKKEEEEDVEEEEIQWPTIDDKKFSNSFVEDDSIEEEKHRLFFGGSGLKKERGMMEDWSNANMNRETKYHPMGNMYGEIPNHPSVKTEGNRGMFPPSSSMNPWIQHHPVNYHSLYGGQQHSNQWDSWNQQQELERRRIEENMKLNVEEKNDSSSNVIDVSQLEESYLQATKTEETDYPSPKGNPKSHHKKKKHPKEDVLKKVPSSKKEKGFVKRKLDVKKGEEMNERGRERRGSNKNKKKQRDLEREELRKLKETQRDASSLISAAVSKKKKKSKHIKEEKEKKKKEKEEMEFRRYENDLVGEDESEKEQEEYSYLRYEDEYEVYEYDNNRKQTNEREKMNSNKEDNAERSTKIALHKHRVKPIVQTLSVRKNARKEKERLEQLQKQQKAAEEESKNSKGWGILREKSQTKTKNFHKILSEEKRKKKDRKKKIESLKPKPQIEPENKNPWGVSKKASSSSTTDMRSIFNEEKKKNKKKKGSKGKKKKVSSSQPTSSRGGITGNVWGSDDVKERISSKGEQENPMMMFNNGNNPPIIAKRKKKSKKSKKTRENEQQQQQQRATFSEENTMEDSSTTTSIAQRPQKPTKKEKKKKEKSSNKKKKKDLPFGMVEDLSNDFKKWYRQKMIDLNRKPESAETLMYFLMTLKSDEEVDDYIFQVLGNDEKVKLFSKEFKLFKSFEVSNKKSSQKKKKSKKKKKN